MKHHHNYSRGADTRHPQTPKEVAVQFEIDCMDKGQQIASKQADNNHTKQRPILFKAHTYTMRNGETQDIIRAENGKDKIIIFATGDAENLLKVVLANKDKTWKKLHTMEPAEEMQKREMKPGVMPSYRRHRSRVSKAAMPMHCANAKAVTKHPATLHPTAGTLSEFINALSNLNNILNHA